MGGSGSSDPYRPDISTGGGAPPERDCTKLRFSTTLQQPPAAPTHPVGAVLELVRVATGGATAIAAVDDNGHIVGTVVEELADLLRCTASGVAYVADVRSAPHGIHTVAVRASDRAVAVSQPYSAVGSPIPTTDQAALDPDPADIGAEIVIGANRLRRTGLCELRSLLRVGVPFDGTVNAAGAAALS